MASSMMISFGILEHGLCFFGKKADPESEQAYKSSLASVFVAEVSIVYEICTPDLCRLCL